MSIPMPFRNTAKVFGLVAVALHWIVAAIFLTNYALVFFSSWFLEPGSEAGRGIISTHTALGVSVIVFVVIRIVWRLMNVQPDNPPGSRLEHFAAHAAHVLLYGVMIVLPLTGYLGFGGTTSVFFLFELPNFQDTWLFQTVISGALGLSWARFEGAMDTIHKTGGAYLFSILIAAHILAAFYHHLVRRDDVLKRMVSPRAAAQ